MTTEPNDRPAAVTDDHDGWSRTQPPSKRVVETVATALDGSPARIDPLYDAIDPDALDALFVRPRTAAPSTVTRLTFEYSGFSVTVTGDGTVAVVPLTDSHSSQEPDEE